MGKEFTCNAGDLREEGSIPGSGRSLEKDMATHSSIPAWEIPWTEEPGRPQSMGLQRVIHDWLINWARIHALDCSQENLLIALFLGGGRMLRPINGTFFWVLIIIFTQFRAQIRLYFFSPLLWSESLHPLSWLLVESLCHIIENSQGFLSSVLEYVFSNKLMTYLLLSPSPFGVIHLALFSLQRPVFFLS